VTVYDEGPVHSTTVFERFTDRARRVLVLAQEEARLLNHDFIGTEHILLGLIREGEGVAAQALDELDISLEAVRERVEETIGLSSIGPTGPTGSPPFTPRSKKVLELSLREAMQLGHNHIGTEHVLLGIVREGEGVGAQVLNDLGADGDRVRQTVLDLLGGRGDAGSPGMETQSGRPLLGSSLRRSVGVGTGFAACSFCGRQTPEAGQLVSGRLGAFICEHCIRDWHERLAAGGEGTGQGRSTPSDAEEGDDPGPENPAGT
jgi:hypothetical protein